MHVQLVSNPEPRAAKVLSNCGNYVICLFSLVVEMMADDQEGVVGRDGEEGAVGRDGEEDVVGRDGEEGVVGRDAEVGVVERDVEEDVVGSDAEEDVVERDGIQRDHPIQARAERGK